MLYFVVLRVLLTHIGLQVWFSEVEFNVSWELRVFTKPSSVPAMDLGHLAVMRNVQIGARAPPGLELLKNESSVFVPR